MWLPLFRSVHRYVYNMVIRYSLTMGKVKHDRGRATLHNYRTKYNTQNDTEDATQAVKDGMSMKLAATRS
jgi:hypothetical protein